MSVFRRGVRIAHGAHVDELPSDDSDSDTEDELEMHAREEKAEVSDVGEEEDDSGPVLSYPSDTGESQHQRSMHMRHVRLARQECKWVARSTRKELDHIHPSWMIGSPSGAIWWTSSNPGGEGFASRRIRYQPMRHMVLPRPRG